MSDLEEASGSSPLTIIWNLIIVFVVVVGLGFYSKVLLEDHLHGGISDFFRDEGLSGVLSEDMDIPVGLLFGGTSDVHVFFCA